jgi:hypothetical protein
MALKASTTAHGSHSRFVLVCLATALSFAVWLTAGAGSAGALTLGVAPFGDVTNGTVHAVAVDAAGRTYLGGEFTSVGSAARSNIARLLPNGTVDSSWDPGAVGAVYALAVSGTGVYAGGDFTSIGGGSRTAIAKLSTESSAADPGWSPSGGADLTVRALAVEGSYLYVGGRFLNIGGEAHSRIARLATLNGTPDSSWNPSADGDVLALATSASDVYLGGSFTQVGSQSHARLAKVSLAGDGTGDAAWVPGADGIVRALALSGSSELFAGGDFTQVNAEPHGHVAKLAATGAGAPVTAWNPAASNNVFALAVAGSDVYAGGPFTTIGGSSRNGLARLSSRGTGAADAIWNPNANGSVEALAVSGAGTRLAAGGDFNTIGGAARQSLALFMIVAPAVGATGSALAYTENDGPVAVDSALTATDTDSEKLSGATVRLTGNYTAGQDRLDFTDGSGITGLWDDTTGSLTLSGDATVTTYRSALRSVTYTNSSEDPSSATRTVSFQVTDTGALTSNVATRDISVLPVNDKPTVATSAGTTGYTENGAAATVDSGLSAGDVDDTMLEGAKVSIAGTAAPTDVLSFTPGNGISGLYASGVLTLTGSATISQYEAALASVGYSSTSDDPATSKEVSFTVNDGSLDSDPASKSIVVTPVNDAPVVTTSGGDTQQSRGAAAVAVDSAVTASDVDDTHLEGAVVRLSTNFQSGDVLSFTPGNGISGTYVDATGVLTLSGPATVGQYEAALRSVGFATTASSPTASKTVEFKVNDGQVDSNLATKGLAVNDPPVLVAGGSGAPAYTENGAPAGVDPLIGVTDVDSPNLTGATAQVTTGFNASQDGLAFTAGNGITGGYDATTGTLTLTGSATVAHYQEALRSVTYANSSDDPTTATRTVTFAVTDASGAPSNAATQDITITAVDDDPVAVADSPTIAEDAGVTSLDVLGNDTDPDAGPKSVATTLSQQPSHGVAAVVADGTGVTYTPAADYCSATPDSFKYTLAPGGSEATVSVTVTCVDDAPVAVADSLAVAQDAGATPVDVLGNDTDVDAGPKSVASVTQPGHGIASRADDGGGVLYTPSPGYCNSGADQPADTFTYVLNGGATAAVSVRVECAPPKPDPDPPADGKLSILSSRNVATTKRGALVRVRCAGASGAICKGALWIEVPTRGRAVQPRGAKLRFTVVAGRTKSLRVRVPSASRARLASGRKTVVRAVARLDGGATVKRLIRLAAARG